MATETTKKKTGRTKVTLDPEKVEQLAGRGLSYEEIALTLGIGERTLRRRLEDDPEVKEALVRGRAKGHVAVANALYESALKGNLGAQIFYLKARCGWREESKLELSSNQPLQVVFKNDLKD